MILLMSESFSSEICKFLKSHPQGNNFPCVRPAGIKVAKWIGRTFHLGRWKVIFGMLKEKSVENNL